MLLEENVKSTKVKCPCCGEDVDEPDAKICDECGIEDLCLNCAPHDFHKENVLPSEY